ncbi:MAG: electron transport complex subunit RsxA, partial [Gammaproteobacteria bacterium]|nr:electron transport complex subunit RsxA [Gammaproteobacteria bacterium]
MAELLLILLSAALVNNFVLVQFLGLCPFVGSSGRVETAVPMTLATMFVLTVAALGTYLVNRYLLIAFEVEYLRIIAFIVIIAATVQFTEMFVRAASPV